MYFKAWFTLTALVFATALAGIDDPGPQTFDPRIPSPTQNPQYATKEVILYLTPSQIKSLESGKSVIEPVPVSQSEFENSNQAKYDLSQSSLSSYDDYSDFRKQLELQNQQNEESSSSAIKNQQEKLQLSPPPVEEPDVENPSEPQFPWYPSRQEEKVYAPATVQPESYEFPQSYSYFNRYHKKKSENNINIKIFHPLPHDVKLSDDLGDKHIETQTDPLLKKKFKLVPYEYINKSKPELIQVEDQTRDQLVGSLQQKNIDTDSYLSYLSSLAEQGERNVQYLNSQKEKETAQIPEEELLKFNYAPKYNDQKSAIEIQKYLSYLKKEKAFAESAKGIKSEGKEVKIPKIKRVKFPQSQYLRVPQPVEVKVPQPYPVPYDVFRPVPIPIVKSETVEIEKPFPYEVEKQIPVPVTKNVYVKVDKPYFVERVVPVDVKKEIPVEIEVRKPQKLTILRHVWQS